MRIAVDCHMVGSPRGGDGGNGRYALNLVNGLAQTAADGDDAWALVSHSSAVERLQPRVRHAGITAANLRRLGVSAHRTLSTLGADAAVFQYVGPLRGDTPIALIVHDVTFMTHPHWLPPRARWMLRFASPRYAPRAQWLFVPSHSAGAELHDAMKIPPEKIHVVSPCVANHFTPDRNAVRRVRDRFEVEDFIFAVGDLSPRKNFPALVQAVERLALDDHPLVLAGDPGRDVRRVTQGRVKWLGRVHDLELADLYRAAAVTVVPSLHEGFGLPAAEAMACASPVVVSNRGALPEVVGDAALVVSPTPDALAEGIRAALEQETADRLRAAGPTRAQRYTHRTMGEAAWTAFHTPHP